VADTPLGPAPKHRRGTILVLALAVAVGALGFGSVMGGWLGLDAEAEPTTTSTVQPGPSTTTTIPPSVPVSTLLVSAATPDGTFPTFDRPDGSQIGVGGFWYGYPMTLPVIDQTAGWFHVRMPERPNQSTAWVRASDVVTSTTPWRIVVSISGTRVTVFKDGYWQFDMPAGLGKPSTPTPPGSYFVAVIERNVGHGYGDPVLDLSAHSEAIQSWQGAGDAIIALHGQISASSAARIGTTGTHISNGCIRLHYEDQAKLIDIPVGTPVDLIP
jgi:lipoprotein-anchoring transpeptidase ErfK/SrfK